MPILRHGVWTCFNKNLIHTNSMGLVICSGIQLRVRVYQVTADLVIFFIIFYFFFAGNHWETTQVTVHNTQLCHYLNTKTPKEIMKLLTLLMCLKVIGLSLIYLKSKFYIFSVMFYTLYPTLHGLPSIT